MKTKSTIVSTLIASAVILSACQPQPNIPQKKVEGVTADKIKAASDVQTASAASTPISSTIPENSLLNKVPEGNVLAASSPTVVSASQTIAASEPNVSKITTNLGEAINSTSSIVNSALEAMSASKENAKSENMTPLPKNIVNEQGYTQAISDMMAQNHFKILKAEPSILPSFRKVTVTEKNAPDDTKDVIVLTISDDAKFYFERGSILVRAADRTIESAVEMKLPIQISPEVAKYVGKGFDSTKTFKITKGNGERKLAVFTDPDCPFCQRLENHLKGVDNVEITYIYFPITGLHPDAENKVNRLWNVAPNERSKVWEKFIETRELPENSTTNHKYDYNYMNQLKREFNVEGTPTLFNINSGEITAGALSTKELIEFLDKK